MSSSGDGEIKVVRSPSQPSSSGGSNCVRTVNVLCIVGAIVGLVAILTPWLWTRAGELLIFDPLLGILEHVPGLKEEYLVGGVLFIVGTLAAFLSTAAGFIQLTGLAVFFLGDMERLEDYARWEFGYDGGLSIGFFLGILSASIVLASLARPTGVGLGTGIPLLARRRWLVFPRVRNGPRRTRSSSRRSILSRLRSEKKWVMMITAVAVVAVVTVPSINYLTRTAPPLSQVQGGILWVLNFPEGQRSLGGWNGTIVSLNDSSEEVVWDGGLSGLSFGSWCAVNLGSRCLQSLDVNLTMVDWAGDGVAGYGDSVYLTTQNSTAFIEDTVYKLRLERPSYHFSFPTMRFAVSFEFHDGHLDSWISEMPPEFHGYYL